MSKATVLIVEDDLDLREALADTLQMAGIAVVQTSNANDALFQLANNEFNLVISDVQMPGMDGHQLLKRVNKDWPEMPVILMTAYGTIQKAVDAIQCGARDYLVKPFEAEVLISMVQQHACAQAGETSLIAEDPQTRAVLGLVSKVAATDATVLICGESGTGKEVIAQALHRMSPRKDEAFIAINCAAIPENMLEAMLFGYEKGAFTGAYKSSPGKFEQANGGTLLLDEISEMDLGLQAKLLRVLQEREVERLGGQTPIELNVRVLATTNRNMKEHVAEGRFREDLFYRLNVFPVTIPPLRARTLDVIPLFQYFLKKHQGAGNAAQELSEAAKARLLQHRWPGNVRELENVAQRALILAMDGLIDEEQIMFETDEVSAITEEDDDNGLLDETMKSHESQLILQILKDTSGSRKDAAEKLGISQRTLRYKLAKMREQGYEVPSAYGN